MTTGTVVDFRFNVFLISISRSLYLLLSLLLLLSLFLLSLLSLSLLLLLLFIIIIIIIVINYYYYFFYPLFESLKDGGIWRDSSRKNIYCKGKFSNIDAEIVTYVYIAIKGN